MRNGRKLLTLARKRYIGFLLTESSLAPRCPHWFLWEGRCPPGLWRMKGRLGNLVLTLEPRLFNRFGFQSLLQTCPSSEFFGQKGA